MTRTAALGDKRLGSISDIPISALGTGPGVSYGPVPRREEALRAASYRVRATITVTTDSPLTLNSPSAMELHDPARPATEIAREALAVLLSGHGEHLGTAVIEPPYLCSMQASGLSYERAEDSAAPKCSHHIGRDQPSSDHVRTRSPAPATCSDPYASRW
jgi:hypothetical protein